jgi:DNA-binding MarR family transcriptional regulator
MTVRRRNDLNLSDYLPYLVNRLGTALVVRFSEEALARHDLSISMWRVLVAASHAGPQRQIDLSELTSIDVSTLSRIVTRLVHMGLLTRARSVNSNREVTVALTTRATELMGELVPIARRLEREAIAGLSAAELATTRSSLRRMYQSLVRPEDRASREGKLDGEPVRPGKRSGPQAILR